MSVAIQMNAKRVISDYRVSILNMTGNVENKSITKSHIIGLTKLHSRDIRLHLPNQPVGLFIRDNCIIINMFYIKVIIMYDNMIIYDIDKNSKMHDLVQNIQERLKQHDKESSVPFEFIMLDMILHDICTYIQDRYQELKDQCDPLLSDLLNAPTQKRSVELLPIKNDLKKLEVAIKNIYDSLDDLLENVSDIKKMYLTHKSVSINECENDIKDIDHNDMEDLLETYFFEIDKILDRMHLMANNIEETDDTVWMMLDISRNRIMTIDLWINYISLALALCNLISGIFGMNLVNYLETDANAFSIVCSIMVFIVIMMVISFKYKYRKIKI